MATMTASFVAARPVAAAKRVAPLAPARALGCTPLAIKPRARAFKAAAAAPVSASLKEQTVQAAVASAVFASLASAESASAAQELVQLADGRPLLFAGLFLPVLGWVAFNIGAPALRQIDAMGGNAPAPKKAAAKKRAAVAGLTGLSAAALLAAPEAADAAQEMAQLADGRPLLFAALFLPVLGWVAFNIGAPALRQLDAMSDAPAPKKGGAKKRAVVAGLTGLSAAALLAAPEAAQAAQDVAQLADGRPLLFAGLFLPVLGWVAFNIGAPALRQIDAMSGDAPAAKKATKKR